MPLKKNIAIIGSGISGLSTAYFLKDRHHITIYEKNSTLGGHSRTISIKNKDNQEIKVDTGFIVLNDKTYPNLNKLFKELKVEIDKTEMSFSISDKDSLLEWSSQSLNTIFAQRKNLFNISMLKGVRDIIKFNKEALIYSIEFPNLTLGEMIAKMRLTSWFKEYYIIPIGGSIWSCSYEKMMDFPATTFITFFHNHGLLTVNDTPQWYTLKNKSIDYVSRLQDSFKDQVKIIKNSSITSITRDSDSICITDENHVMQTFDEVVFACNPTEIIKVLKDINKSELNIFSKFSTQKNIAYTHSDYEQMPKISKCWSSWNYLCDKKKDKVSVTYWMNKLQHIDKSTPIFVTLNPVTKIPEEKIYDIHEFHHPVFDHDSITAQKELKKMQGINRLWFCGAYNRYGFHEDGIWSAVEVVEKIS